MQVPRSRSTGRGGGTDGWAGAAADHGRHAAHECFFDLLRTDEMNMGIDAASGDDHAFTGNDFGGTADGHGDVGLDVGIAGLADAGNLATFDTDVGLDDTPMIDNHRVGDDGIHYIFVIALRLPHAVANDLAAAEFDFLTIGGEILFDFDEQTGIGQAQPIATGGAEH